MRHFGFADFRGSQLDIVAAVLEGKDVVAILATGSGKSLTYQFPALWTNRAHLSASGLSVGRKVSLVISPLLSLMQDQVMSLAHTSVRACFFNSNTQNRASAIEDIANATHDIVYTSPESLCHVMPALQRLHALGRVALVAVDEAHCVSEWGHDFRPEYRKLDCVRAQLPGVPIIALTATATPAVQADIARSLRLRDALHVRASFNRSELQYHVKQKQSIATDIGGCIAACSGSVVVYALTRDDVESICAALNRQPSVTSAKSGAYRDFAAFYHAGMPQEHRTKVHEDFLLDRVRVVVATVAFGMGIDKKNVRAVVHWGMPKSMEEYIPPHPTPPHPLSPPSPPFPFLSPRSSAAITVSRLRAALQVLPADGPRRARRRRLRVHHVLQRGRLHYRLAPHKPQPQSRGKDDAVGAGEHPVPSETKQCTDTCVCSCCA